MGEPLNYLTGFGNHHVTEAVPGALPEGRNSPQRAPLGLYAEQISGTAFTQPAGGEPAQLGVPDPAVGRAPGLERIASKTLRSTPVHRGGARTRTGCAGTRSRPADGARRLRRRPVHRGRQRRRAHARAASPSTGTAANADMADRYFVDADGELLVVPQEGGLLVHTELGRLDVAPGEIVVVPRGIRFRVDAARRRRPGATSARTTAPPSRCPSGARSAPTGWPTSATSSRRWRPTRTARNRSQVVQKFGGNLWAADYDHSPLDVVGWHGNYAPVQVRPEPTSWRSGRSASTTPTRRSSRC